MNAPPASPPWEPHEDSLPWEMLAAWRQERAARMRAEAALARERAARSEGEARLTSALAAARVGTWRMDLRTGQLQRDASLQRILGVEASAAHTPTPGWALLVHPEDLALVDAELTGALRERRDFSVDYRIVRPDGGVRWVRDRGTVLLDEHARPRYLTGAAADVTEEHQAQEERERFFRVASDLFCVAGTDGLVHRINPAFATVLGWCEAQLVGRPFVELVHPEDRAAMLAELTRLSQDERVALRFEHRCLCADGGYRWLSWTAHSLPEQRLIYAAARDITQDKRAEEQARLRADFEQKLIGIVSHDLRNPLGAILLGTQGLLRRTDLDPRVQRCLTHILASAQRGSRMVRDLLDFTQARLGGGIRVHPRALELHRLAEQTLDEVRLCHPGRELRLRHEGEAQGEWDADRLAQVLTNLVSNAVKYSPGDSPVEVTTRGGEDHVLLSVHNQGEPIPAALRARLFEPMQRGGACADTSDRSVGLGLYIVKHLVEAHGGQVAVESSAPGGTRFTVRLPRRAAPPGPWLEHGRPTPAL